MNSLNIYRLSNDIRDLYCRTGVSDIEGIFIKISQSGSEILSRWLKSSNIKSSLENPSLVETFELMSRIRKKYSEGVSTKDLVAMLMGKREAIYIPLIAALVPFVNEPLFQNILFPFKDIIVASTNFKSEGDSIPSGSILKDLNTIASGFNNSGQQIIKPYIDKRPVKKGRPTKKDKRVKMFSYLLKRFSDDLSRAADTIGLNELSSEIRNGALVKPVVLNKYINVTTPNMFDLNEIRRILKVVTNNVDEGYQDYNYNFIKDSIMDFMGVVDIAQLTDIKRKRQEQEDVSAYMIDDPEQYETMPDTREEMETLDIGNEQWLLPSVVGMLSLILSYYYNTVKY